MITLLVTCKKTNLLGHFNFEFCLRDFSIFTEDRGLYSSSWNLFDINNTNSAFHYIHYDGFFDLGYYGKYSYYSNGGYFYPLLGNLQQEKENLTQLQSLNWIDKNTRAISINFATLNPNVYIYSFSNILYEILPSGNVVQTKEIKSVDLFNFKKGFSSARIVFFAFYFIIIFYVMLKEIRKVLSEGKAYFKKFWNTHEWVIVIISWACLGNYFVLVDNTQNLFDDMKTTSKSVPLSIKFNQNLAIFMYFYEVFDFLMSFCVFLNIIRVLRLFEYNKKVYIFVRALHNLIVKFPGFLFVFTISWIAYVQLMYLMFNEYLYEYSSMLSSIESAFLIILGSSTLNELIQSGNVSASLIFLFYNITIGIVLISIAIVIITEVFQEIKRDKEFDHKYEFDLWSRFKSIICVGNTKNSQINKENKYKKKKFETEMKHVELNSLIDRFQISVNKYIENSNNLV